MRIRRHRRRVRTGREAQRREGRHFGRLVKSEPPGDDLCGLARPRQREMLFDPTFLAIRREVLGALGIPI